MNIVILSRAQNDASPSCIYVHEQSKAYAKLGDNVIEICTVPFIPFMKYLRPDRYKRFKHYKGTYKCDGVTIIYKKKISLSNKVSQQYNGYFTYLSIKGLIRKLKIENKIDVLHTHMLEQEGYAGYLIKKKFKLPVIATTHGTDCFKYFDPNPKKYLVRTVLGLDRIVAVSNKLKETILNKVNSDKIDVIYNGTSIMTTNVLEHNNLKSGKRKYSIISVGTFLKRKNFNLTIEGFADFCRQYPSATLTLVGEGPEFDNLQALVDRLNIRDKVTFTGRIANECVISKMKEHEVFLMPSEKEGFGIVYLEAMQCACVPIAMNDAGISDIIVSGQNGFLLKTLTSQEVNKTLLEIYSKNRLSVLQKECLNTSKGFTWESNAKKYIELFNEICK